MYQSKLDTRQVLREGTYRGSTPLVALGVWTPSACSTTCEVHNSRQTASYVTRFGQQTECDVASTRSYESNNRRVPRGGCHVSQCELPRVIARCARLPLLVRLRCGLMPHRVMLHVRCMRCHVATCHVSITPPCLESSVQTRMQAAAQCGQRRWGVKWGHFKSASARLVSAAHRKQSSMWNG